MIRYFITKQNVFYNCGFITVVMYSNITQHLWLLSTFRNPLVNPQRDTRTNTPVFHQNNYTLWITDVTEQQEPGATNLHTFVLPWPAGAEIIWFYTINMGVPGIKQTRSPIFAYTLHLQTLLHEPWFSGFPGALYPWQAPVSFPNDPTARGGHLNMFGNATLDCIVSLDLTSGEFPHPLDLCNGFIEVGASLISGNQQQYLMVQFTFFSTVTFATANRYAVLREGTQDPCAVALDGMHYYPGFSAERPARIAFNDLLTNPPGHCNPLQTDLPDPVLLSMDLVMVIAGNHDPLIPSQSSWGYVRITQTDGALTDVSKEWRALRLHPQLV